MFQTQSGNVFMFVWMYNVQHKIHYYPCLIFVLTANEHSFASSVLKYRIKIKYSELGATQSGFTHVYKIACCTTNLRIMVSKWTYRCYSFNHLPFVFWTWTMDILHTVYKLWTSITSSVVIVYWLTMIIIIYYMDFSFTLMN